MKLPVPQKGSYAIIPGLAYTLARYSLQHGKKYYQGLISCDQRQFCFERSVAYIISLFQVIFPHQFSAAFAQLGYVSIEEKIVAGVLTNLPR
jgi:hypothetical protein